MIKSAENAVQAERLRIARDMHDTISQSLFGMAYALNGCQKMVPKEMEALRAELIALEQEAQHVRQELRHVIFDLWPNELTSKQFSADLIHYVNGLTNLPLDLELDIRGNFSQLSPYLRRSLYRICQESLANIVNHAEADHARVCLDIADGRARLLVRDNGKGFEPQIERQTRPDQFGVRGMANRTSTLGGTFDLFSRPKEGTSIIVDIPIL